MQDERQQLDAAAKEAFEVCDTFVNVFPRAREAREAGSRSALRIARNWESPGGGQKFRGRRGREQPAAAWRRSRHAYSGVLTQEARETGSRWESCRSLARWGQYIIADLPTYAPAFGLVSHFALALHTTHKSPTDLPRAKHLMRSVDARLCSLMVKVIC